MRRAAQPAEPRWYVLGITAAAALAISLAGVLALADREEQARVAEALRADIHAEYELFCAHVLPSAPADQQARCVTALWQLRAWEDQRRALDTPQF